MSDELTMDDFKRIMANPFYAITIDETLSFPHEPLVSKEDWVKVQLRTLFEDDDGKKYKTLSEVEDAASHWLWTLIDVLEGNYV